MNTRLYSLVAILFFTISAFSQKQPVTLEDVWKNYTFYAQSTSNLNSMRDGLYYTALTQAKGSPTLEKFSYETAESDGYILSAKAVKEQTGKDVNFDSYSFSPDEKKVLLATETEAIYRHSSKANYFVYDLETSQLNELPVEGKQQLASFSPTENKVAYVYENRMHILDLEEGENSVVKSFGRGEEDVYIAGAVDWVYEEEFSFHKGYEWSPDGKFIAFYQFDEREVPLFSMDLYGENLYPSESEFKYPKAGEPNSEVHISFFDLKTEKVTKIKIPEEFEYIPRIKWTPQNELVIFTMNRPQNELKIWKAKAGTENATLLYEETAPSYINIDDDLTFLKDGSFIWTSEKGGYNHIYHFDKNGSEKRQITKGEWPVSEFYGIDEKSGYVYYQSAEESPMERGVYRINLKGKKKQKLSPKRGWNSADFSEGFNYFVNTFSSIKNPTEETLHTSDGKLVRTIVDNENLKNKLNNYKLSEKEFFDFETEYGVKLNGWMIKPTDFDASKKYPVLMFVYGGPGAQTVKNQWDSFNHFYYQTLANQGYVIVSVDNRGTGARGRDFRTVTYKELGKYETEDQIASAKYLQSLPYIDDDRIGIWGWSYGGYMSSLCITKGADVFKLAIAVAPVTNWRFYDTIYTERYMRTPQENPTGYDENSPINHVEKLRGHYLLVHGAADDNVHLQNTMRMTEALVQADKQFDLFVYPDKNHGIFGGNTRFHLYQKMTDFIKENL